MDPRSTCALIKVLIIGVFPLPLSLLPASFSKFFWYCSAKEEKASQKCRTRCVCLIRCAEAGDPDRSIRVRAAPGHECTPKQWFVLAYSKIFFKKKLDLWGRLYTKRSFHAGLENSRIPVPPVHSGPLPVGRDGPSYALDMGQAIEFFSLCEPRIEHLTWWFSLPHSHQSS